MTLEKCCQSELNILLLIDLDKPILCLRQYKAASCVHLYTATAHLPDNETVKAEGREDGGNSLGW